MLELNGIGRRYGDVQALDDVTFTLRRGEVVGFVGRNGAGKTTTMRVVVGIVEPDTGTVVWDGAPLGADVRRRIGYLPEERGLYPRMGAVEQLDFLAQLSGLDPAEARRTAVEWVDRVGLGERADDPVGELSLGNQQRVQLAAALVGRPELIVMDEPFAGLDPIGVDLLGRIVTEQARAGAAVLFSSHQLEVVERLSDRIVMIDAGRVIADGPVTGSLWERFMEVTR
jgi:ABC-2 type transport system ATP-binding protein